MSVTGNSYKHINFFLAVVIISLFLLPSVFAKVTMPREGESPNIITQTAQIDKAAVLLINSVVSGTVVTPDFDMIDVIDVDVLGDWYNDEFDQGIIFFLDGSWLITDFGDVVDSGTYYTLGDSIVLTDTENGETVEVPYFISTNDELVFTPSDDPSDWFAYYYVGPAEDIDIFSLISENLVMIPKEGFDATLLNEEIETGASGTGFIVSPDGYIVTNAHVILTGEDPESLLLNQMAKDLIAELSTEFASSYNIPDEEKDLMVRALFDKMMDYFFQYGEITNVNVEYYAINGITPSGENIKSKSWRALVKKQGEVYDQVSGEYTWGRDVAVLKIPQNNLPTVRLGDSDGAQVGDNVFIIGYPGLGLGLEDIFVSESQLEPTVSSGVISAKRTLKSGVEAIQTDAAINHGNSGGPVYNSRGEVIGIATFGAGPEIGIESIKFAMPINTAKEFLKELNVENEKSLVDTRYGEALQAFWDRDCETAIDKMQEVLNIYPGHPYAQEYITESYRAQSAGDCAIKETPTPITPAPPPATGTTNLIIVLLIVIVIAGTVILRTVLKKEK